MTEKRKYGKVPVLMKPTKKNPPAFEFSRDPAKRKKRWDKITRSTPEQLRKMAFDMAAEARVRIEIQQEQLPPLRMKNVPKSIADEIEKWYYSSVDRVSFWMGRKNQIAILSRKVVHRPIPKTVKDWIVDYSTKHKSKEKAPSIFGFNLFRYNPRSGMSAGHDGRWAGLPHWRSGKERKIPAKSFPLMYDAGGGYVEEEAQFQGYYGIIKMLEASYLEKHGIEGYGMGSSLQRAEYYRSFGWLMPQDVSKYAPYVHEGPRSYLLLDEGDVLGWDSSMEFIWRPVYSKPKNNPQTGLPGIGEPPVDPATIQPHLDWPRWPLPPWTKCKHAECKPHTRRLKQMVEQTDAIWKPPTKLNEGFYYIQQKDLNNILQSQTYLDGQEAHRQAKIAEAERIRAQHQGSVEDYRTNPSNIPFPVPEEYQEELERRLTEEMTAEGYRPLRVQQDFIDSGGYDDAPSDWSYVQGEYQEFLDEIEAQDWDEAYAEYSDVEGHTAYYLWTNYRIDMPVYTHDHIDKVLFRIRIFEDLFAHYGFDFGPEYLKGGSNYEKVFKVRNALDAAADAQGKPRVTDDDEQLSAVVKQLVAARKDMSRKSSNDNSIDYPDSLDEAFDLMKRVAKKNRELEMTVGFDAWGWWKENKGIIDKKYGEDPVPGASWLMPVFDPDFDPYMDENDPSMDDFYPDGEPNMHFYNQLMRIPQTEPPTPRKILQIALNIGQGQATGIVDEDYTMSDFIAFDNPRTPGGKKFPTKYLKGLTKLEKMIAEDEIDKGYKYDADDPEAYKFWKSDIKATARGLKIGTSKHRDKYYKMYRKNIDTD